MPFENGIVRLVLPLGTLAVVAACGGASTGREPPPAVMDTSLGASDVFDVRVYDDEQLSGSYQVAQDGTIDFPLMGRIAIAGLQPTEIADLIKERLVTLELMHDPQVSVFVREYNSKRVSVMGAVARPGTIPTERGMTLVEAISRTGGLTAMASSGGVVVTRRVDGVIRRYRVDVSQITEGRRTDFQLQAGDIVYVPERVF